MNCNNENRLQKIICAMGSIHKITVESVTSVFESDYLKSVYFLILDIRKFSANYIT